MQLHFYRPLVMWDGERVCLAQGAGLRACDVAVLLRLKRATFLPSSVFGPVERCAFRRLASSCFSEIICWVFPCAYFPLLDKE